MAARIGSEMIGRTYLYNGNQYLISDVRYAEDDLYDVFTDKRRIRVNKSDLKNFQPVQVPSRPENNTALILALKESNKPMDDLAAKLMETIATVEKDASFIPKAAMINKTAKNLIDIRKAQIELMKLVRK